MENNVTVEGCKLAVNGNSVTFENTIREYEDFGDFVVVDLALTTADSAFNQNVVAVNPDGTVRWRIDKCPDITAGGHDSYAGLHTESGQLWVYNLNGMKYKVNHDDGTIADKKFVK